MPAKTTLPLLAGLSALGAASGVWLGGEAIGEIDPFFFAPRQESFVADRIAYRSPDWAQVQIGEYRQDATFDGVGEGPMPGAVYASPALASYGQEWAVQAERQAEPAVSWADAPQSEPERIDPERERIVRYASYPVSREEAALAEAESEVPEVREAPVVHTAALEIGTE